MKLWQATLETRHFSFDALGRSEERAKIALECGLAVHAARCSPPLERGWYGPDDINVRELALGQAYIDGSPLLRVS